MRGVGETFGRLTLITKGKQAGGGGGGWGWHEAMGLVCLPLAAPIGLVGLNVF